MKTFNEVLQLSNLEFHKEIESIDLSKTMSKFEKMEIDEETILISKLMMKDIDIDTIKTMIAETKKDAKEIVNGKSKNYFITSNITNRESLFKFMILQKKYTKFMSNKETIRAWEYLTNKDESFKYGFVDENDFKKGGKHFGTKMPKQTDEQYKEWADKSSAKINGNIFENQFDLAVLISSLK